MIRRAGRLLALVLAVAPGAEAHQAPRAAGAAAVSPDTVKVGEPVLVGVRVRARPGAEVTFPRAFPEDERIEQVAPAELATGERGEWTAYYRLVAWRPGGLELPSLAVGVQEGGASGELRVAGPPLHVRSVLPADTTGLRLRPARLPVAGPRIPWLWMALAALLAALLLARWLRRRARAAAQAAEPERPAEAALRALAELRSELARGAVDQRQAYDRLEGILRLYLQATRGWSPGAPLRERSGPAGDGLGACLRRSALSRFARLRLSVDEAVADAETCAGWVRVDAAGAGNPAGAGDAAGGRRGDGGGGA